MTCELVVDLTFDLMAHLRAVAALRREAVALVEAGGATVTYDALLTRVDTIACGLRMHGVTAGDRVLFAIRPSTTAIATMLALFDIGAVVVAAPIGAGDTLFAAQMQLVQPAWVVAESLVVSVMRSALLRRLAALRGVAMPSMKAIANVRVIASGPWLPWLPWLGGAARLAAIERRALRARVGGHSTTRTSAQHTEPAVDTGARDAFIVFTSGTTSAPKAVVHSRASLTATLAAVSARLALMPGDRLLARDLHLVIPALLAGATAIVSTSGAFDADATLRCIDVERVTHMFEVTANLERLVDRLETQTRTLPSHVRTVLVGAAPVRRAFFERLHAVLPADAEAWCVYGMTEMLPIAAIELREKLAFDDVGDIVGAPVSGVELQVNAAGELLVRGPHRFSRYLGRAAEAWHATGDLACLDHGRIVLLGRAKDMIIRRETNIYPELHEPVVERMEGVRRCAMVGVYDEQRADERVVLVVEPDVMPATDSARAALTSRIWRELRDGPHRIDAAALPDEIVIATLPRAGRSHKLDKQTIRESVRRSTA
jgi:acyl-CoA synthetase (AMP-forming)/AMP-acid ligase II